MKPDIELTRSADDPFNAELDVLIVGVPDEITENSVAAELDRRLAGKLTKSLEQGLTSKDALKTSVWLASENISAQIVLTIGLGKKIDVQSVLRVAATAIKQVCSKPVNKVGLAGFPLSKSEQNLVDGIVIGALTGSIGQDLYREKKNLYPPKTITLFSTDECELARGTAIAAGIAITRNLVNQPPNYLFPESFVEQVLKLISGSSLQSEVWDETRLAQERCETMLAVAKASDKAPRLLMLRYAGTEKGRHLPPIALVGKGVTFDSGGLSIKPNDSMLTMKCDMAGGATVAGIMLAIEQLKIDRPVIGLIGLVENVIAGNAYKLGDVLRSRAGKTIEIHNTDAEGRLVLADVLNVALDHKPSHIIDFATLTGACVVALGTDVGGIMSNNADLSKSIEEKAGSVGEYIWPLPMFSLFDEQIQGKVADLKNVGDGRWGGAITAAKFLEQFVDQTPWAHIDLAGPAFADKPKSWCDAGGTGYIVHTMIEWLRNCTSTDSTTSE